MSDPESEENTDQNMCVEIINDREAPQESVMDAIKRNDLEAVRNLIKNGASVNATDNTGYTALHAAVQNENLEFLEFLLEQPEVNINAQTKLDETPLLYSLRASSSTFALKLLAHGADVNIPNVLLAAPLHLSVQTFHDVSLELIKRGADVNVRDSNISTPLHKAVKNLDYEMVSMLLYYGADTDVVDSCGHTPFMTSLFHMNFYVQELLMEFEVDYSRIARDNLSTLFLAFLCGNIFSFYLLERGADVNYIHPEYNALKFAFDSDEMFAIVWDKFNVKKAHTFINKSPLEILLRSLLNLEWPKYGDLWVERLESILFSEKGMELLLSLTPHEIAVSFADFLRGVYSIPIPEEKFYKFLCIWFSCGVNAIPIHDVHAIYLTYGDSDVFDFLITMDVIWDKSPYCLSLPYLICDVRCDKSVADIFLTYFKEIFNFGEFYQLLLLGTPSNEARQLFYDNKDKYVFANGVQRLRWEKLEERLKNLPIVPSLKELSRNSAKKAIIDRYNIKKCSMFYSVLKRMPIPNTVKHILSFKVPIHIFTDQ